MKKYLKCIKKLPLAKSILGCLIFLIGSSYALADYDKKYRGIVSNVSFKESGKACSITIKNNPAIPTDKKQICDFANKAKEFNKEVYLDIHIHTHWINWISGPDEHHIVGVGFLNTQAKWPQKTPKENLPFKYLLVGKVENVYYQEHDQCYIAVSGADVRNNKIFHNTKDLKVCRLAEDAFYSGMRVQMIATVDNYDSDYTNNINDLRVTQCCTREQRN
ncbi:Conserved hypothetical protein [Bacteriophage APSE-7]|uniref:hypothetical protein n=1 Tax=Candidatus Williamhamiltonella defendens TaxID=138072 RepID=UPI001451B749|nr:hypothetical protein [Candidatus Hamiltonella defensa]CAB3745644.1 Conserved hypothetical protein [Bacteriophage APSE-7]